MTRVVTAGVQGVACTYQAKDTLLLVNVTEMIQGSEENGLCKEVPDGTRVGKAECAAAGLAAQQLEYF